MSNYELTVVLPGGTTSANKKKMAEDLAALVKTFGGELGKLVDWGEKELAYKIDKNTSGVYLHFPVALPSDGVAELPAKLNLDERMIRYLLVEVKKEMKTKRAGNNRGKDTATKSERKRG